MKKVVCEGCGSADIVKQDGFYVCQNCGLKYSDDSDKKTFVNNSVSISNTVITNNGIPGNTVSVVTNGGAIDPKAFEAFEAFEVFDDLGDLSNPANLGNLSSKLGKLNKLSKLGNLANLSNLSNLGNAGTSVNVVSTGTNGNTVRIVSTGNTGNPVSVVSSGNAVNVVNAGIAGATEASLANARRAKSVGDWEETEQYYNMVEQQNPRGIEAVFYSAYCKVRRALLYNQCFNRKEALAAFTNTIHVIDEYYDSSQSAELVNLITAISNDLLSLFRSNFAISTTEGDYLRDEAMVHDSFAQMNMKFIGALENIANKDEHTSYYELLVNHYAHAIADKHVPENVRKNYKERLKEAVRRIKIANPGYIAPEIKDPFNYHKLMLAICCVALIFAVIYMINCMK